MRTFILPTLVCAAVVIATACWPADVPWGGDDAVLIASARWANAERHLVTVGLSGSFGVPYGPVPTQVYQALLAVSPDLLTVVQLHAILVVGTTAVGLLWLTRSLGWSPWLAVVPLASPFTWFYGRLLWDNPFALPAGTLLVAGYAAHLAGRRGLSVAMAAAAVLPFIHPMTVPLVAAVAGHGLLFRRSAIGRRWRSLVVIAVCVAVSSGPYLVRVVQTRPQRAEGASTDGYAPLSRAAAAAYPLLAGRLFSGFRFFDGRGPERGWETTPVGTAARAASAVAFPLVWVGVAAIVVRSTRAGHVSAGRLRLPLPVRRERAGVRVFVLAEPVSTFADPHPNPLPLLRERGPEAAAAATIPILCVVALALQSVIDAAMRIAPYPHYFNGTWAAAIVVLWAGLRSMGRWAVPVGIAYAVACGIATLSFAIDIHRHGGGPVWHGPTLGAQQKAPGVRPGLH